MLALLMLSAAINYIDRGCLPITAQVLSEELSISVEQIGWLFSAFFWSYVSFRVMAGWLANRYNALLLGVGYYFWSTVTLLTAFANTFATLLVLCVLLGIGESLAFPAYSKIIINTCAADRRGLPDAFMDSALKITPALGMLLGGLLLVKAGWQGLFFLLGLCGMAWLVSWSMLQNAFADLGGIVAPFVTGLMVFKNRIVLFDFLLGFCRCRNWCGFLSLSYATSYTTSSPAVLCR